MNIAILGYGVEGKALIEHFKKSAKITVCDENPKLKITHKNIHKKLGKEAFKGLSQFDLVFRSPGIHPSKIRSKKNLTSLTRYFFEHCPCPIIGVTGTKGKGTTSTLIHKIVEAAGYDAYLGGNIGVPPLEFLKKLTPQSIVVLELSSFQTQTLQKSPHIGVLLKVTPEHLDVHKNLDEYHAAKAQMISQQSPNDHLIFNDDHEISRKIARKSDAKKWKVSTQEKVNKGAYLKGKWIVFDDGKGLQKIMKSSKVGLLGLHNLENILPAITVAMLLDVSIKTIRSVVENFKGLPHRLEFAGTHKGIQFYNDSFSTTPETSIAAIRAFKKPVHLIAGGSEKHSDFKAWAEVCVDSKHLKTIVLTGNASANRMEKALLKAAKNKKPPFTLIRVKTQNEAIDICQKRARRKHTVLLSPACASFEAFKNYKVRGEQFKQSVSAL